MDFTLELFLKIFSIFICLALHVCGLQEFSQRPQDLSVIRGQTAVIMCAVENRVGKIQWAKGQFMLGFERNIPGFDGRYSVIGDDRTEYNLQITNTELRDDDDFECQVQPAENNPPLKAKAHLTILVPPNTPEIVNHTNGSTVEVLYTKPTLQLTCRSAMGRPAANIKWFRNDEEITENVVYSVTPVDNDKRENAQSILTITPKYPDDNNVRFTCQAYNNALINGPLRTSITLSVQFPPGEPVITGYQMDEAVDVNDTVAMTCKSTGGNPLAQIAWFKDNTQVDFSYKSGVDYAYNELIIVAQKSDNDAEYRCEAWNIVNAQTPFTSSRKLVVHFPPTKATITGTREAKAGEMLTLTCTTSNSNPAAVVTWIPQGVGGSDIRSRTEPSPDGGYVTISEIDITLSSTQTNAIYTCSATNNQIGVTVADTAHVGVLYPPSPPQITGYTEGEAIKAGEVLKMRCTALRGNPPATLQWKKGNDTLTDVTDLTAGNIPSLELAVLVKPDDNHAIYRCLASNRATETPLEALKQITVHFPPKFVNITSQPANPRSGHQLELTCVSGSSNPPAVITWIHNNQQLQGTSLGHTDAQYWGKASKNVLDFIPTSADHDTPYGCRATNLAIQESVHDAVTLDVRFKPEFRNKNASVVIIAGESRVINFTAIANPAYCTYQLKREGIIVNTGDIESLTLDEGVLTISAITKEDKGQFAIVAMNTEGMAAFDFSIDVQYPAEITEGAAVEGAAGDAATLRCVVSGHPMVPGMVTWKRDDFDMTRALPSYENGVGLLVIETLEKTDSGAFTCIADNGVGTPAEQEIELTVKFTPEIDKSPEFHKAASHTGKTGRLICRAQGSPSVTFQWQKDGVNIQADATKYEIEEKVTDNIHYENILLVKDVQKADYGMYGCIVTNERGDDRLSIFFENTTKPDAPYDLEFVNATHNSVTLRWKLAFNGGLQEAYRVRFKVVDTQGFTYIDVQPENAKIFTVKGLSLGTEYELNVMAHNQLGNSDYAATPVIAKTSNLKPKSDIQSEADEGEDMPVIIILVVCVVGILLLALNIALILFFVRRRKKRMENGSDTTSHSNTIELYGPTKETHLYPVTASDEARSYGTNDRYNEDDYSDDYKSYEDEDLKRVFLPPPEYGGVTYSHNKLDSPTFEHRHPLHTDVKGMYGGSDTDSCRKSPWQYEADAYKPSGGRGKGTFDSEYPDTYREQGPSYEPNGRAGGAFHSRPKSVTELSERSSRPSSRGTGHKTPPPPPVRSSSKGAVENSVPPLPARNYDATDAMPRYVPPPGSSYNNVNVIQNPSYDGPSARTPTPQNQPTDPTDDMRGYLV